MRAESLQADVLGTPFFNLGEIPGKLQPLCGGGGGLVSVSEGGCWHGGSLSPPQAQHVELPGWLLPSRFHLFIFGRIYPSNAEISGLRGSLCVPKAIAWAASGFWGLLDFGKGGLRFIGTCLGKRGKFKRWRAEFKKNLSLS